MILQYLFFLIEDLTETQQMAQKRLARYDEINLKNVTHQAAILHLHNNPSVYTRNFQFKNIIRKAM